MSRATNALVRVRQAREYVSFVHCPSEVDEVAGVHGAEVVRAYVSLLRIEHLAASRYFLRPLYHTTLII